MYSTVIDTLLILCLNVQLHYSLTQKTDNFKQKD